MTAEEQELITSTAAFALEYLGIDLYDWQAAALGWFESKSRTKASICTPNGAGKSSKIVATLVLWWLSVHKRGKVVVTTKSGLQLDSQVLPAIKVHAGKFKGWAFNEREIKTPTGGLAIFFTTDEEARAEGHHSVDEGPLLIIVDEAKSVPEPIFEAIDRCTYNALLLVSSTGKMGGQFYDSQTKPELGFKRLRVGLKDCPHISKERIDEIIAKYGIDHPFTRSTLFAEFMVDEGEMRFNAAGLKSVKADADEWNAIQERLIAKPGYAGPWGELQENRGSVRFLSTSFKEAWCWVREEPIPGCRYIAFGDPMSGEQSKGSKDRDGHAFGIIRDAYTDDKAQFHPVALVAALHADPRPMWDNDILAERFRRLLLWYGDPMAIIEANNSGMEVLRLLNLAGAVLWKREKRDAVTPGKKLDVVGFLTTSTSKTLWIGPVAAYLREQNLECRYLPAVSQLSTFILTDDGRGAAQSNCHDDWVTGIGLGLFALPSAMVFRPAWFIETQRGGFQSVTGARERVQGGAMS